MKDIAGKKFNKLTAVKFDHKDQGLTKNGNVYRTYYWEFSCECGGRIVTNKNSVKVGQTTSCGCARGLEEQLASLRHFYRGYKAGAIKRGLIFELSIDEFKDITSKNCYYCNSVPSKERRGTPHLKGFYVGNGVDRKINSIGYTVENCVACCEICNFMKRSMDIDDFISHIKQILKTNECE